MKGVLLHARLLYISFNFTYEVPIKSRPRKVFLRRENYFEFWSCRSVSLLEEEGAAPSEPGPSRKPEITDLVSDEDEIELTEIEVHDLTTQDTDPVSSDEEQENKRRRLE